MKKFLFIAVFVLALIGVMFAQTDPRTVYQEVQTIGPHSWTWTEFPTSDPHYYFEVTVGGITKNVTDIVNQYGPGAFCISSDPSLEGLLMLTFDQQFWPVPWTSTQTILVKLWYRGNTANPFPTASTDPAVYATYTMAIPAGADPILNVPSWGIGDFMFMIPPIEPTYTVNMTTVPAGYITPATLGPVVEEDLATIYGTYTPTAISPTGGWTPRSLTIDAYTPWIADGDNFVFNQEFVWEDYDYYNYYLTLNVDDTVLGVKGTYDINGYAVEAGVPFNLVSSPEIVDTRFC